MPPEAIIKALQERVNRQRMLKEKFEGELEAIVQAETERAFANLDEDKRSLLIRILTRMMKIKQHGADSASSWRRRRRCRVATASVPRRRDAEVEGQDKKWRSL